MLEKRYIKSNIFFATYYIFDTEARSFVGILEYHDRQVKNPYYVGWNFSGHYIPNTDQAGQTCVFENEAAAIDFIVKGASV